MSERGTALWLTFLCIAFSLGLYIIMSDKKVPPAPEPPRVMYAVRYGEKTYFTMDYRIRSGCITFKDAYANQTTICGTFQVTPVPVETVDAQQEVK